MVQVGDIHVGRAETAERPTAHVGEVFILWDALVTRYDQIHLTQLLENFVHDKEFKAIILRGLTRILEKQVNKLEGYMNTLQIPLPSRPPKSVRIPATEGVFDDEFIFRQIFCGIQATMFQHTRYVAELVTTDPLRNMFISFLKKELDVFNKLILYGKLKGWLQIPPEHTPG